MSFINEIRDYSIEDLELIIQTQEDLYSIGEMDLIKEVINTKKIKRDKEYQAFVKSRLPTTILCPKCDGENPFENNICQFCGCKLNKLRYYDDEFYADKDKTLEMNEGNTGYTFHYVISFLIPIIGFIVGAIMLSSDSPEKSNRGKFCIVLSAISTIVSAIIIAFIL